MKMVRSRAFPISVLALLVTLAVLLAASCGQGQRTGPEEEQQSEEPASTQETTRSDRNTAEEAGKAEATSEGTADETTREAREEESADAPEDDPPFTADPEAQGGESGAARSIAEVRFGRHEGYERAVIQFDSPRVPLWTFGSPTGEGYSRITFPGLRSTAVSGGNFGGSIMDNFYVVRAPDGGFFVDIFATGAFQYRLLELRNPGRLAIDYRPASVELDLPLPVRGDLNVVMQPRTGAAVSSPLTVLGYSRNFEASTTMILRGGGGEVLARKTVLANDWAETWGYFEGSLEFPPFQGEATLQVGAPSARDGSFEGVEVPVVYGG